MLRTLAVVGLAAVAYADFAQQIYDDSIKLADFYAANEQQLLIDWTNEDVYDEDCTNIKGCNKPVCDDWKKKCKTLAQVPQAYCVYDYDDKKCLNNSSR